MNRLELFAAIDALATRDPGRCGYGYADSQHRWRHDPAIDHARQAFHEFLDTARTAGLGGTFLLIGLGRRGGCHRACRLLAQRVVSVGDGAAAAAFRAGDFDAERDAIVVGDAGDPAVIVAVAAAAGGCELLLLDGGDSYEQQQRDWQNYAPLVRPGGIVAIADQSQAFTGDRRPYDVDRLAVDIERDHLRPSGVRMVRHGGAHAIHHYVQTAATATAASLQRHRDFVPTVRPQRDGECGGFGVHAWNGALWAVPGEAAFDPRGLFRNGYDLVLTAASRPQIAALVEATMAVEPQLAAARAHLQQHRVEQARAIAAAIELDFPGLRPALIPSLEAAPLNKRMLLLFGTLALFGDQPRQGAALLRQALAQDMLDRDLLLVLSAAYLQVLGDAVAGRQLLDDCKRGVRQRKIATVCHERLTGNVLWRYPQLLQDVRGVIQVGAHTGEEVEAFNLLAIEHQVYIEPQPDACKALQQRCRQYASGTPTLIECAVGERRGERALRFGEHTAQASLLPTHALAKLAAGEAQTRRLTVPVRTLDELVADGRIDAPRHNLLFIDTEGSELEVLAGARQLLGHIDVVCVSVFNEPVYDGAPMPQQIQFFLRELEGGGFGLRAFDVGPDPRRGDAVFRRIGRRRGQR